MSRFARIDAGRVVEIVELPGDVEIGDAFPEDFATLFLPCGPTVKIGWLLTDSAFGPPPAEPAPDKLPVLKLELKAAVDEQAERLRLRYITPGVGQAMTYMRKVEQARAVLATEAPQAADYPLLAASIGTDGADITAVATTVLTLDAAWEQIGAAIEWARLGAKRAIELAQTEAAARAVVPAWPE